LVSAPTHKPARPTQRSKGGRYVLRPIWRTIDFSARSKNFGSGAENKRSIGKVDRREIATDSSAGICWSISIVGQKETNQEAAKMIDHVSLSVSDIERSKSFYLASLTALGLRVLRDTTLESTADVSAHVCFGLEHPSFCINDGKAVVPTVHVAFTAQTRQEVFQRSLSKILEVVLMNASAIIWTNQSQVVCQTEPINICTACSLETVPLA
jgi:hypothetical protein